VIQEDLVAAHRRTDLTPLWVYDKPGAVETLDTVLEIVLYDLDVEDSLKDELTKAIAGVFTISARDIAFDRSERISSRPEPGAQPPRTEFVDYSRTGQQRRAELDRLSEAGLISHGEYISILRQHAAFETSMAATNMMTSSTAVMMSLSASYDAAIDASIGEIKRKLLPLQISAALQAFRGSVSGKYYLRPFASFSGPCVFTPARWGFLLVDMETGAWREVTTSPYEFMEGILRLNLFPTTFTPDGSLVLTRGTGLDPTTWAASGGETAGSFPPWSLLAYDVASLELNPTAEYATRRKAIFGEAFDPTDVVRGIDVGRTRLEDVIVMLGPPFETYEYYRRSAKWMYAVEISGTVYSLALKVDLNRKDVVVEAETDCCPWTFEWSDDMSDSWTVCKTPAGEGVPIEEWTLE
jgi:hypothetical protein